MSFLIVLLSPPKAKKIAVRDLILAQAPTDIPDMSR